MEENPLYMEAMHVKMTLHLSAKSIARLNTKMLDGSGASNFEDESLQGSKSRPMMHTGKVMPMG